jgi:hypothetical protein
MAHVQTAVVKDRQRSMLAAAAAQREGRQAWLHSRMQRKAERAERRATSQADHAERLRTRLSEMQARA